MARPSKWKNLGQCKTMRFPSQYESMLIALLDLIDEDIEKNNQPRMFDYTKYAKNKAIGVSSKVASLYLEGLKHGLISGFTLSNEELNNLTFHSARKVTDKESEWEFIAKNNNGQEITLKEKEILEIRWKNWA